MRPNDFASYLLAIGICNLLLYFAFYIIMKVSGAAEPPLPAALPLGRHTGTACPGTAEREGESSVHLPVRFEEGRG